MAHVVLIALAAVIARLAWGTSTSTATARWCRNERKRRRGCGRCKGTGMTRRWGAWCTHKLTLALREAWTEPEEPRMRGTWQGSGTWQTTSGGSGGDLILAFIVAAILIGSGAVSAAVSALVTILIVIACLAVAAVLGGLALLLYRAAQS